VLASGLRVCLSGRQRALVKPTATPFGASRAHRRGSVLSPCFWVSRLSCKHAVSRFSFAHTCSSSAIIIIVRTCVYTTALLHGSRSLAASLPCRATGWLSVCARVCTICSPSVPHFAARLACLRSACLLAACYLRPATCCCCSSYTLPLRYSSTRRLPTRSLLHPASHIPDYRVGCPHPIHPSIHPDSRSLSAHQSLPCLLALPLPRPASLPWRAPDLSSSFAWHTAASHSMRCSW
jgi:hypothetical protein